MVWEASAAPARSRARDDDRPRRGDARPRPPHLRRGHERPAGRRGPRGPGRRHLRDRPAHQRARARGPARADRAHSVHGTSDITAVLVVLMVSRKVERIGDNAKNIYDLATYDVDLSQSEDAERAAGGARRGLRDDVGRAPRSSGRGRRAGPALPRPQPGAAARVRRGRRRPGPRVERRAVRRPACPAVPLPQAHRRQPRGRGCRRRPAARPHRLPPSGDEESET